MIGTNRSTRTHGRTSGRTLGRRGGPAGAASRGRARGVVVCAVAGAIASSLALSAGGCVARRTVGQNPHLELGTGGNAGANSTLVDSLIVRALPRVLSSYPRPTSLSGTPVRVQFPAGMTPDRRRSVEARLAVSGYEAVSAVRGDGPDVYHIGRVWRRGGEAKVDIYRPVYELGVTNGWYPMQAITVEFTGGGLGSWQVTGHRAWAVGAFEPPAWVEPIPAAGRSGVSGDAPDAGGIEGDGSSGGPDEGPGGGAGGDEG